MSDVEDAIRAARWALRPGADPNDIDARFLASGLILVAEKLKRLELLINTPTVVDFLRGVRIEAAHQVERWPSEHDAGKSDADWFWLIGYLAGKAIRPAATPEKKLHHIITTAAACLNWHRHATGESTSMRPGIEPPEAE